MSKKYPVRRPFNWESVAEWQDTEGYGGVYTKEYCKYGKAKEHL